MSGGEKLLGGVLSENNLVIVKRNASPSCKPPQIKSMQPPVSAPFHFYQAPPPPPSHSHPSSLTGMYRYLQRKTESESLNLKDSPDKEDKDVFITPVWELWRGKLQMLRHSVNNTKRTQRGTCIMTGVIMQHEMRGDWNRPHPGWSHRLS